MAAHKKHLICLTDFICSNQKHFKKVRKPKKSLLRGASKTYTKRRDYAIVY